LKEAFGDKLAGENDVEAGYHATVDINFADLGDDKAKDQLITDLGMIKPILIGGVFKQFFQALAKGEKSDPFNFPLRGDTKVYFFPGDGRVTVIFEVDFPIRVDAVVGQIFLQEFQDARRRLGAAPPCKFSQNPPQELAHFNITESGWDKKEGMRGYLSFAILSSHVSTPAKIENTVNTLQSFRNFLQYHIKCSKAYFHSRMRHQVRELLKVLRRAIVVDHSKIKRKADGTPFSR
jgi:actin related protein 2/3 complex subunit 2